MRASWATIDVTPTDPVPMAGYAARRAPFEAIHDRLEANALLLQSGDRRLFFLSLDFLYAGPVVTRFLEEALAPRGIHMDDILVTASHSHFAPATDPELPSLGETDARYLKALLDHLGRLLDRLVNMAPIEIELRRARLMLPFGINRRRNWPWPMLSARGVRFGGVVNAPNEMGRRCDEADVIVAHTLDGSPRVVIWHYACHPVAFPLRMSISAEFPGVVRDRLRHRWGNNLPVLFWQGFAGDIRPNIVVTPSLSHAVASALRGPRFAPVSLEAWMDWCRLMADRVAAAADVSHQAAAVAEELSTASVSVPVSRFIRRSKSRKALRIQRLSFGLSFTAVFASAEVLVEHSDALTLVGNDVIGVGYAGDVFGYLPTDAQVQEGGYEATGWLSLFNIGDGYDGSLDCLWRDSLRSIADCGSDLSRGGSESRGDAAFFIATQVDDSGIETGDGVATGRRRAGRV